MSSYGDEWDDLDFTVDDTGDDDYNPGPKTVDTEDFQMADIETSQSNVSQGFDMSDSDGISEEIIMSDYLGGGDFDPDNPPPPKSQNFDDLDFGDDISSSSKASASSPKSNSGFNAKPILAVLALLLLGGGILFGYNQFMGGDDNNNAGGGSVGTSRSSSSSSTSSSTEESSSSDDYDSKIVGADGKGDNNSPGGAIEGYINGMYVDKDVDEIFKFLDPKTTYQRVDTLGTLENIKAQFPDSSMSLDIEQKEPGSFTWNLAVTIKSDGGKVTQFAQQVTVVQVDGKWYVDKIRDKG